MCSKPFLFVGMFFFIRKLFRLCCRFSIWLCCRDFSYSAAVRWNSVEIEFQNPSLAARPRPSASLIISVNLLIKMSCKRFPSFHSDHYQHARLPAEYLSFSPSEWAHTRRLPMHPMHSGENQTPNAHRLEKTKPKFLFHRTRNVSNLLEFQSPATMMF